MNTVPKPTTEPFPLARAADGLEVFVTSFDSDKDLSIRLMDLGLVSGARVRIVHRRGGDLVVARDNMRLALGEATAERIMVVPCGAAPVHRRTGAAGTPRQGMT